MPTEESVVERLIREATERGEFDDVAGAGAPIPDLGTEYDPDWWAKRFVTREKARDRADDLRRLIRSEVPRLRLVDPEAASERVRDLNEMIVAVNEHLEPADRIAPIAL